MYSFSHSGWSRSSVRRPWLAALAIGFALFSNRVGAETPRLVLQITVDQLRGDVLPRLGPRLEPGGFRRLLDHGANFANAHYESANTFTASGHAVLVTGATTAGHGMVANDWFDREAGRSVYCVSDPTFPVLGGAGRAGTGFSPAKLLSSTVGDEIVSRYAPRARAFALAGKDRSAIIPGGRRGKAFWYSEVIGGFTSSSYYYDVLPEWIESWNGSRPALRFRDREWQPARAPGEPVLRGEAENRHARPEGALGRIFPHPLVAKSEVLFYSLLRFTPFLDELTAEFARELISQERLGQAGVDYLSISFSGLDYVGHSYGPNSREYEDSLLRLDRVLAGLFEHLESTVGMKHVLVVLSSDHGTSDIPEALQTEGFKADRIRPEAMVAKLNSVLRERFDVAADLVGAFVPPGLYLDRVRVRTNELDFHEVETALAEAAGALPGVAWAFTRSELLRGELSAKGIRDRVQRAFHPQRSGDVVIVQAPFWYMYPEPDTYAAMHGSPYRYDTFVPLIISGPGIRKLTTSAAVSPAQIAPTLAALLRTLPPSGCADTAVLPGLLLNENSSSVGDGEGR